LNHSLKSLKTEGGRGSDKGQWKSKNGPTYVDRRTQSHCLNVIGMVLILNQVVGPMWRDNFPITHVSQLPDHPTHMSLLPDHSRATTSRSPTCHNFPITHVSQLPDHPRATTSRSPTCHNFPITHVPQLPDHPRVWM